MYMILASTKIHREFVRPIKTYTMFQKSGFFSTRNSLSSETRNAFFSFIYYFFLIINKQLPNLLLLTSPSFIFILQVAKVHFQRFLKHPVQSGRIISKKVRYLTIYMHIKLKIRVHFAAVKAKKEDLIQRGINKMYNFSDAVNNDSPMTVVTVH